MKASNSSPHSTVTFSGVLVGDTVGDPVGDADTVGDLVGNTKVDARVFVMVALFTCTD